MFSDFSRYDRPPFLTESHVEFKYRKSCKFKSISGTCAPALSVFLRVSVSSYCCICSSHSHCYDGWPTVHPFALSILFQCVRQRERMRKKKKAAREKKVKKGGGGGGKETEGDLGEVRWILMSSLRVSDWNLCLFCLKHCSCLRSAYTEEHRATITKQTQTPQWCC